MCPQPLKQHILPSPHCSPRLHSKIQIPIPGLEQSCSRLRVWEPKEHLNQSAWFLMRKWKRWPCLQKKNPDEVYAFFSSRSERKHFLWRWYCRKKHKNVKYRGLYSYWQRVCVITLFPNILFVLFLYVERFCKSFWKESLTRTSSSFA